MRRQRKRVALRKRYDEQKKRNGTATIAEAHGGGDCGSNNNRYGVVEGQGDECDDDDEEEDEDEEGEGGGDDAAGASGVSPPIEDAAPPVEPSPAFIHSVVPIEQPFDLVARGSTTKAGAGAGMRGGATEVDALGEAVADIDFETKE